MKYNRKPLINPRTNAFIKQNGLCYYCHNPMWNKNSSELSSTFKISNKNLPNFKCTGEHLIAHCEGGSANQTNIVAACWFCNSKRHQRKANLSVNQYQILVASRLKSGKWNTGIIEYR